MATTHHQVLIIGGGTAGITVAASLRKRAPRNLDIAIVEPLDTHYYQPAFTLVGAGLYDLEKTRRPVATLVPSGVALIRAAASEFVPAENSVKLSNGETLSYDWLIVCTGLALDWDKVQGLPATLGKNGVCSNYSPDSVRYTAELIRGLKAGAKAVFTQAPLPFKCPGAPQKIVYLTADHLRRKRLTANTEMNYYVHAPVIFGVPYFARQLVGVAERYGIKVSYQHNLVVVDGSAKTATFEIVGGEKQGQRVSVPFDMLHVTPPQSPPVVVRSSPLVNAAGFVEVDQKTMRHVRFANVFSLGDVCSTANSKTAAAVRKQSPVVVRNLLSAIKGASVEAVYDGYASCPLTTARGKAIVAEFIYGGKVTPTWPLNPSRETRLGWWIKATALPIFYWNYMLKGHERFFKHNTGFQGDTAK